MGDARVGIEALRVAARRADQQRMEAMSDAVIESSVSETKVEIRHRIVEMFTDHQQALYDVITDRGEVAPSKLYEAYRERVDDSKSARMYGTT